MAAVPSSSIVEEESERPSPPTAVHHFKNQVDQSSIKLALHKSPFFTCLDEEQQERFVQAARLEKWEPGQVVILEGCVDEEEKEDQEGNITAEPNNEENNASNAERNGSTMQFKADPDDCLGNAPALEQDDDSAEKSRAAAGEKQLDGSTVITRNSPHLPTEKEATTTIIPPAPRSGVKRSIYIIRKGSADVWHQATERQLNSVSLGPGSLFGEGGFLFGRQHSASVVAASSTSSRTNDKRKKNNIGESLECWVVDYTTFRDYILPSENMSRLFRKYAKRIDDETKARNAGQAYMTMEEFVEACEQEERTKQFRPFQQHHSSISMRIANTYNILRRNSLYENNKVSSTFSSSKSLQHKIYLSDFCFFHMLMARPDPEVDIAFLLMDQRGQGQIYLEDLARFVEPVFPDLDLKSEFFRRYFGPERNRSIRNPQFSQFFIDLKQEMGQQAFLRAAKEHGTREGYLPLADFVRVLKTACGSLLPIGMAERLEEMYCNDSAQAADSDSAMDLTRAGLLEKSTTTGYASKSIESVVITDTEKHKNDFIRERYFTYGDFLAFQEVVGNLSGICNTIDLAQRSKKGPVSPDDFKVANRVIGLCGNRLSRRQVDIVFQLFDLDRDGYISSADIASVCGVDFVKELVAVSGRDGKLTFAPPPEYRRPSEELSEEVVVDSDGPQNYTKRTTKKAVGVSFLGMAGALGVVVTYPFDLIKTRLMNQRMNVDGTKMYSNSLLCFQKAVKVEGFAGLFRGLTPQLLGVAPEKAIKLYVNDLLRQSYSSLDETTSPHKLRLSQEVLVGACTGACQLLVTNPVEIIKIRMQLQGETSRLLQKKGSSLQAPQPMNGVLRDIGYKSLYRGASACLLRDVPFSALYFPAYAACKDYLVQRRENSTERDAATVSDLLFAGTLAGIPAALLTSPADVIKTRLQVIPRPGEMAYSGIQDCATKIYRQEGLSGFFQGSLMRVLRIAPQFAISILAYEQLTRGLGFSSGHHPPTNAPVSPHDYRAAFSARET